MLELRKQEKSLTVRKTAMTAKPLGLPDAIV